MDLFTILKKLWSNQKYTFNISDDFNPFIIQRWISFGLSDDELILLDDKINSNKNLHADRQKFFDVCSKLFKGENRHLKYIKPLEKKRKNRSDDEIFDKFCELTETSKREMLDYLRINPNLVEDFGKSCKLFKG